MRARLSDIHSPKVIRLMKLTPRLFPIVALQIALASVPLTARAQSFVEFLQHSNSSSWNTAFDIVPLSDKISECSNKEPAGTTAPAMKVHLNHLQGSSDLDLADFYLLVMLGGLTNATRLDRALIISHEDKINQAAAAFKTASRPFLQDFHEGNCNRLLDDSEKISTIHKAFADALKPVLMDYAKRHGLDKFGSLGSVVVPKIDDSLPALSDAGALEASAEGVVIQIGPKTPEIAADTLFRNLKYQVVNQKLVRGGAGDQISLYGYGQRIGTYRADQIAEAEIAAHKIYLAHKN